MNITAKQIAEMVGVSRQAVYSVLSRKPKCLVSPEKREKILFLAKAYHYKPNMAAVSLNGKPTFQIGAVLDSFTGTEGRIISRMVSKLEIENYSLQSSMITGIQQGLELIRKYSSNGMDAVIFSGSRLTDVRYEDYPVPLLAIGTDFGTDLAAGSRMATEHLIQVHGHRKIVHVAAEAGPFPKYRGYCEAMKSAGLKPFPVLHTILNPHFSTELKRYLDRGVTAFVASGDGRASRLIYYLRIHGIRVPEDVAVTGMDAFGNYPEIASVAAPIEKIAVQGCRLLLEKIRGKVLRRLEPELVVPEFKPSRSCGCPPVRLDNLGEYYTEAGYSVKMKYDNMKGKGK